MKEPAASADGPPKCTFLGCSQPATYGVERAYMSPVVYCLEHMEEIARRKSSARTLRRVFKLDEPATGRPPARAATTTSSRRSASTRLARPDKPSAESSDAL